MNLFTQNPTPVMLDGPVGRLQAVTQGAADAATVRGLGVVCHPHPLYSGTMNNKVVTTVFKTLVANGCHAVRFNYRGVGDSEGEFAHAMGETDDCLAVVARAQQACPPLPVVLVGFSFGAYVAARAALQLSSPPGALILIAPAVAHAPFAALAPLPGPCHVLIPEDDEVVSAASAQDWVAARAEPIQVTSFAQTSHFFHGQLLALGDAIQAIVKRMHT